MTQEQIKDWLAELIPGYADLYFNDCVEFDGHQIVAVEDEILDLLVRGGFAGTGVIYSGTVVFFSAGELSLQVVRPVSLD